MHAREVSVRRLLVLGGPLFLAGVVISGCGSAASPQNDAAAARQTAVVAQAFAQQTQTAKLHNIATVQALATAAVVNGNRAVSYFAAQAKRAPRPARHVTVHRAARPRPTPTATPTPTAIPTAVPVPVKPTSTVFKAVGRLSTHHRKHHQARHATPTPVVVAQVVKHPARRRAHRSQRHTAHPTAVPVAVAQPTARVSSRAVLAYRARILEVVGKVHGVSLILKRSSGSIDPSHADFDPSLLQSVSAAISTASHNLDDAQLSLAGLRAPSSFVGTQQTMQAAINQYQSAAQHLQQAIVELEAGTRDASSADLALGSSSIQQGDQTLQSVQDGLSTAH